MKRITTLILGVAALSISLIRLPGQVVPTGLEVTGIEVFSTDSSGNKTGQIEWNTVAGDSVPNAWVRGLAGFVNGPADSLVPVTLIPGSPGFQTGVGSGEYVIGVEGDSAISPSYVGVSLWFNSSASPQISVFASTSDFRRHSVRPEFSDAFTQGTATIYVGTANSGSLIWFGRYGPLFAQDVDLVGPFAVGADDIWDGTLLINLTVVPVVYEPSGRLGITQIGTKTVQITWLTNSMDQVLEYSPRLPAPGWSTITNAVTSFGDHHTVLLKTDTLPRFYRLRIL